MKSDFSYKEVFTRAVEDIITRAELEKLFLQKKRLRIKLGIDATAPTLHIGHAVPLWKIRALQEQGHKAVIVLGDITTQIGDPTGKSKTRPVLPEKEIAANIRAIKKQVEQILLTGKAVYEWHRNSEWFKKMRVGEFMRLLSHVTHARLIERDMFQARIKKGEEISTPELLYPILQGYDSVMIESDMTIIGSDQLFNEHIGRKIQEKFGQPPQVIVTIPLLPGIDGGEKMSKSLGNYIGLADTPQDKFGKAMRILDALIVPYLTVYTDVSPHEIKEREHALSGGENPMETKLFFAESLVRRYHGEHRAKKERARFLNTFSEIPVVKIKHGVWEPVELLVASGLLTSKSEARRLISQKGVAVDDVVISDIYKKISVVSGMTVRVGKRKFARIA
jgi:tyrosyl-tRNA synthetase